MSLFSRTLWKKTQNLELLPITLCYCVGGLVDTFSQISSMSLYFVHMQCIPWPKYWPAELPCKKYLVQLSFKGQCLFSDFLDFNIKEVTEGKCTLLPKKKAKGPTGNALALEMKKGSFCFSEAFEYKS